MTYYECSGCERIVDVVGVEGTTIREECPICEERTTWTLAFVDEDAGVSF